VDDLSTGKVEERLTAGLDLGDLYAHLCVPDEQDQVVEARVASTPKAFKRRFRAMPPARLVLEAGTHSPRASRLLESLGHEVIVANPRMLRYIYGNDSKNDRADAGVVNMSATGTVGRQSGTRIGSGVVCTSDGLIVANDHVVTRWTARSLPGRASRSQQLLGGLPQLHARHHLVAGPGD